MENKIVHPVQRTPDGDTGTEPDVKDNSRRKFLKQSALITAVALAPAPALRAAENHVDERVAEVFERMPLKMDVNGVTKSLMVEPRSTLLDILREQLDLTGTKKGCDLGQCGACTVHVDGHRVNSCLTLGIMVNGKKVTTIEGLATPIAIGGNVLHPMQEAFLKHDGFQCGYCTPGQIMSAVACIREGHANSELEIREYMSGNICRCGAYPNIVNAIQEVKEGGVAV
jgi:xanthine dehydrogenase YagT iron-sulfur-binding subunit